MNKEIHERNKIVPCSGILSFVVDKFNLNSSLVQTFFCSVKKEKNYTYCLIHFL